MELNNLPNEVLSNIFSHLLTDLQKHRLHNDFIVDIWPVRLVCRKWNDLATKQLFQTLTLYHTEETVEESWSSWQHLLDSSAIRAAVRRVAIESTPWEDLSGREASVWEPWAEKGEWPDFTSAIDRICDLPHLTTLEVRFSYHCVGRHGDQSDPERESSVTRQQTLKSVLRAMRQRAARPNMSVINELVLVYLQNTPLPKNLTDGLFENIERLHIFTAFEVREPPEDDTRLVELHEYEPYMQNILIPPIAEQLVELTLTSPNCWGAVPGEFNGKGLHFPRLKTLTLARYVIAHRDQFDWVLAQESLTSLAMHSCAIGSHILVRQPEFAYWGVDSRDWIWAQDPPDDEYDEDDEEDEYRRTAISYTIRPEDHALAPGFYTHYLRWETVFDSIGRRLPHLQHFNFTKEQWWEYFRQDRHVNCEALVNRYLGFCGFWGELWAYELNKCNFVEENHPGTPNELLALTEEADRRAFESLLHKTTERRRTGRSA
ncbi:hypothetical protein G7Z17_g85 [Cylindrodendrum hubeiense]|uniref:F-box domain-containing protein n=1 Tax=Cylindrodendrum hubeiense TaxID=595255 RepID=A0A9P5LGH7_9HYPO|nr:hypothetical protein G7Z17_g85 [Cylindrodendrum hubeiense]